MPTIQDHRSAYKQAELLIKQRGAVLYATFDKNERMLVQFGMFPAGKMQSADAELLRMKTYDDLFPMFDESDLSRLLAVAVMDAANAGPDKIVV